MVDDGTYHLAFWIDGKKMTTDDPGRVVNVVAHEAHHAASAIFGHISERTTDSEPFAYLVGGIAEWLYNQVPDPA